MSFFVKRIAGNHISLLYAPTVLVHFMVQQGKGAYIVVMSCQSPPLGLSSLRIRKMCSLFIFLFITGHGALYPAGDQMFESQRLMSLILQGFPVLEDYNKVSHNLFFFRWLTYYQNSFKKHKNVYDKCRTNFSCFIRTMAHSNKYYLLLVWVTNSYNFPEFPSCSQQNLPHPICFSWC